MALSENLSGRSLKSILLLGNTCEILFLYKKRSLRTKAMPQSQVRSVMLMPCFFALTTKLC